MASNSSDFRRQIAELSENISGLVEELDKDALEALVVSSIRQHRAALDRAEEMYDAWNGIPDDDDRKRERYLTYIQANLENSVQMSLLAALLDHLGYIPVVENDDNASSSE
jgi:Prokaryotic Transcriptional repressor TraM